MFVTALAETAQTTAAETTASAGFQLGLSAIISIVLVGYFILVGLACLITGRVYGLGKGINNYTDESLAKFARPFGAAALAVGVGLCLFDLYFEYGVANVVFPIVGAVIVVIGVAGVVISEKKILVKK